MSSMSELYFDHFLVSPDFLMDIKLEPMDYELCKIACTEEDLKMCKEEFDNFEMQKVDVGLSSPLNVWLPCPGLTGAEDLDLEPTDKSEVEEEQMGFDWPRMESDWLVREVRGSDWLPPVREPDWQLQKFVDPPLPQNRNSNCLLAPHSHELLSQMKPCSVLLDSSTVPKYLSCRNPNMKPKRKQTSLKKTAQKRKKKPATIAVPTQFKTMPPNTFLNLKYLEKNNPDFIYTDFSKSKRELVKPTSANPVSILIPQKTSQIITKPQQMKLTTFKPTSILFVPNLPQPLPGLAKLEPQDTPCEENASACWPCEKCNKSYKLVENFIAHWKKKHSSDPLPSWFSQLIFCASPDKVREIFVRDLDVPESPKIDEIKEEPVETVTTGPEKVHATLKLHVCLRCEKVYKNIASLKKHMTFEHDAMCVPSRILLRTICPCTCYDITIRGWYIAPIVDMTIPSAPFCNDILASVLLT
ncbi:UNVERIFIED_CONTAM: hypothetical protein B566_EDAN017738 [Ephemera danica]|nr:hypothetical protein B566_EDAN017738 [Ephemera danica]